MHESWRTYERVKSHICMSHGAYLKIYWLTYRRVMYVCHTHVCVSHICTSHVCASHTRMCVTHMHESHMCVTHIYMCHTHIYVSHTCSRLKIGCHRILRLFLKNFHLVTSVPEFSCDLQLVSIVTRYSSLMCTDSAHELRSCMCTDSAHDVLFFTHR